MIIRSAISRVSLAVLVLGVVVACSDDEGAVVPPASTEADAAVTPSKPDAGADAATAVTTTEEAVTSEEPEPDAAVVEAGPSTTGAVTSSADVPDATPGSNAPDATAGDGGGDGGSETSPDGGESTGGECMGSAVGGDYAACSDRAAEWCGETYATDTCLLWSSSRDVALFDMMLDCMTEAFDSGDACDDVEAKVDACMASADATACVEHLDICTEVYGDCEGFSVEECDQDLARFNLMFVGYGVGSYTCPYEPSYFLGE